MFSSIINLCIHQENSSCVEGLVRLTCLTGVVNFPVRNISFPFFPHKSQVVRSLSVFYVRHILSELNNGTSELCRYLHMLQLKGIYFY